MARNTMVTMVACPAQAGIGEESTDNHQMNWARSTMVDVLM